MCTIVTTELEESTTARDDIRRTHMNLVIAISREHEAMQETALGRADSRKIRSEVRSGKRSEARSEAISVLHSVLHSVLQGVKYGVKYGARYGSYFAPYFKE